MFVTTRSRATPWDKLERRSRWLRTHVVRGPRTARALRVLFRHSEPVAMAVAAVLDPVTAIVVGAVTLGNRESPRTQPRPSLEISNDLARRRRPRD
jgi:hypothetical protein